MTMRYLKEPETAIFSILVVAQISEAGELYGQPSTD